MSMLKESGSISFLFVGESTDNAEMLSNKLRNKGSMSKYQLATDLTELKEELSNSNDFLLLICDDTYEPLPVDDVLSVVDELKHTIPVVIMMSESDPDLRNKYMNQGASDCFSWNDEHHATNIVIRETQNYSMVKRLGSAEERFVECEKRASELLETSKSAISFLDEGLHIYANTGYAEMFGYSDTDDLLSVSLLDLVTNEYSETIKNFIKESRNGFNEQSLEVTAVREDQSAFPAVFTVTPATMEGEPCVQLTAKEITVEAVGMVDETIDVMTGLLTRTAFIEEYKSHIKQISKGLEFALVCISIDEFSTLKNSLGLDATDELIKTIATTVSECLRADDFATKLSDSSFALLVKEGDTDKLNELGSRLSKAVKETAQKLIGNEITTSIGCYVIGSTTEKFDIAVQNAQKAVNEIEQAGGNGTSVFNPLKFASSDDTGWVAKIKHAIKNDIFKLVYQPIANLHDNEQELYEAMIRLETPDEGLVLPGKFLPTAEKSGLMPEIDKWVTKTIAKEILKDTDKHVFVVKLSGMSLIEDGFAKTIAYTIQKNKVQADRLIFEINEASIADHLKQCKEASAMLRKVGCKVMISSFGKSEQALSYLKHVEADMVKLDGMFIKNVLHDDELKERIEKLLETVTELNIVSIASFVEQPQVLTFVYQAGIQMIQGNFLSEPKAARNYDFSA